MSTGPQRFDDITVADYLAGEEASEVRHEYVDGRVYAMAGGTVGHARVQANALTSLGLALRGKPCQPFGSDMKVRIVTPGRPLFYYPDVSVVCDSNPSNEVYQDRPVVIVEVLSHGTRRTDDGEKREAYFSIPTLRVYVLAEQDQPAAKVYRRTDAGFAIEVHEGLDAIIPLPEIEAALPLSELYQGVDFTPEPGDPEDLTAPEP